MDPLLELIGFTKQHELLATLLQHVLALISELLQGGVSSQRDRREDSLAWDNLSLPFF